MNHKGVCRTAPATQALLQIYYTIAEAKVNISQDLSNFSIYKNAFEWTNGHVTKCLALPNRRFV